MNTTNNNTKTIEYYNTNAEAFYNSTVSVDFSQTQDHFLSLLPERSKILDFGCGSGRDTLYFLNHGYKVEAVDGSQEMCALASNYTGIPVKQMYFQELDVKEEYDAIWACSSILHLTKNDLRPVLQQMADAIVPGGIIYTSFKYGDFEGNRNGRYFSNFTEEAFEQFISDIKQISVEEYWITGDVRPGRGEEKWLNLILRKTK